MDDDQPFFILFCPELAQTLNLVHGFSDHSLFYDHTMQVDALNKIGQWHTQHHVLETEERVSFRKALSHTWTRTDAVDTVRSRLRSRGEGLRIQREALKC